MSKLLIVIDMVELIFFISRISSVGKCLRVGNTCTSSTVMIVKISTHTIKGE